MSAKLICPACHRKGNLFRAKKIETYSIDENGDVLNKDNLNNRNDFTLRCFYCGHEDNAVEFEADRYHIV